MLAKTISFYWVQKSHFYLKITWVKVRNKSNTTKFCNHPFSIYSFFLLKTVYFQPEYDNLTAIALIILV